MVLNQNFLLLLLRELLNFGHTEQLLDQGESLFLALVHDVLHGPSSDQSLKQEHGRPPFVAIGEFFCVRFELLD